MARKPSFPALYDNATSFSLSDLKKWGYMYRKMSGTIRWSIGGEITSTIGISTNAPKEQIVLTYTYQGENIQYNVLLASLPSNLGKGEVLYFICPVSGLRCRKLYFYRGHFVHRKAKPGFYQLQVYGHRDRDLSRAYDMYFVQEKAWEIVSKKYFKKYYRGKPTKAYLKIRHLVEGRVNFPTEYIDGLLTGNTAIIKVK